MCVSLYISLPAIFSCQDELEEQLLELEELTAQLSRVERPATGSSESTTAPSSSLATASVGDAAENIAEDPWEHLEGAVRVHQERVELAFESVLMAFSRAWRPLDVVLGGEISLESLLVAP